MDFIISTFNNRELSLIFWLSFIMVGSLFYKKARNSIYSILENIFSKKIFFSVFSMFLYVVFIIFLFYKAHIWDIAMLKDTIVWFFGFALIILINSNKANEGKDFFKKILLDNFKLILIFEFIINFYSFSFITELFLLPILFVIIIVNTFMGYKKEYGVLNKKIDTVLVSISIYFFIFSLVNIVNNFDTFIKIAVLKSFLLPMVLTVLLLPFIYFFAKYMKYETNKIRQKYLHKNINYSN